MKKWILALSLSLTLSQIPAYSATAPKAGSVCLKQGITKTYQGKKFTCSKSGKKLIWNKGVVVKKSFPTPTPTPSPTPTPTPTQTPAPTPTLTPTPTIPINPSSIPSPTSTSSDFDQSQKIIGSLSELEIEFKIIPRLLWESTKRKMEVSPEKPLVQNIFSGPNTQRKSRELEPFFLLGTKFFHGFQQPDAFNAIYYSFDDISWAKDKLSQLYSGYSFLENIQNNVSRNCSSINSCGGASASMPLPTIGNALFAINPVTNKGSYLELGGIEIHEYAHMVQFAQFKNKPTNVKNLSLLPSWFIEGHAHLAGNAASAGSYVEYRSNREFWIRITSNTNFGYIKNFSKDEISEFFVKLHTGKSDSNYQPYVYSVGYLAVEILASVKGIDEVTHLIVDVSEGKMFEEAFRDRFGVAWLEGSGILASVISSIYKDYKGNS